MGVGRTWGLSALRVEKKECSGGLEAERKERSQGGEAGDSGEAKMGPKEISLATLWAIGVSKVDPLSLPSDGSAVGRSAGTQN